MSNADQDDQAGQKVRFAVIGLNHGHIYGQVNVLQSAGAELVSFFASEPDLSAAFQKKFPGAKAARGANEILEDKTIHLIASASIASERGPLGVQAMRHGKDFFADKPALTTLEQLAEARRAQAETKRMFAIYFSERIENSATIKAWELVRGGAIGRVVQTLGLGPHRANLPSRPPWFFKRGQYGGILCDIASHQADQFLLFTGSTSAEIVSAQVANYKHPQHPELEDFGDMTLRSDCATGYIRVDWFTPDGLGTWGDGRMIILGTEGYIEIRKNCDIGGREGGNHLLLVDQKKTEYVDCKNVELPFGRQLLEDVRKRTETAMPQAHAFMAMELVLRAQAHATRLGHLK